MFSFYGLTFLQFWEGDKNLNSTYVYRLGETVVGETIYRKGRDATTHTIIIETVYASAEKIRRFTFEYNEANNPRKSNLLNFSNFLDRKPSHYGSEDEQGERAESFGNH